MYRELRPDPGIGTTKRKRTSTWRGWRSPGGVIVIRTRSCDEVMWQWGHVTMQNSLPRIPGVFFWERVIFPTSLLGHMQVRLWSVYVFQGAVTPLRGSSYPPKGVVTPQSLSLLTLHWTSYCTASLIKRLNCWSMYSVVAHFDSCEIMTFIFSCFIHMLYSCYSHVA